MVNAADGHTLYVRLPAGLLWTPCVRFTRLRLERQVGCSPSALRGIMHALEAALLETAGAWEQAACGGGGPRDRGAWWMKHSWNR